MFDLWGTLIYHDGKSNLFSQLATLLRTDTKKVLDYLETAWLVRNNIDLATITREICIHFGVDLKYAENVKKIWHEDMSNARCYEDTHDVLSLLKGNYDLVVVSNTGPLTRYIMQRLKIDDFFSLILLSCDVGLLKPNVGIYQAALALLKADAHHVYAIGNDPYSDLQIPKKMGMRTIYVNRSDDKTPYTYVDATVRDLSQVPSVLTTI